MPGRICLPADIVVEKLLVRCCTNTEAFGSFFGSETYEEWRRRLTYDRMRCCNLDYISYRPS